MSTTTAPVEAGDQHTRGDELILQISLNIFMFIKWKLMTRSGHNILHYKTAKLIIHMQNNNRLINDEQTILQAFFYKITLNSSETIVKRKFPLQ